MMPGLWPWPNLDAGDDMVMEELTSEEISRR